MSPDPSEARAIPLEQGWLFALRFPEPVETQFREDYRRVFRGQMRALWYTSSLAWIVVALTDLALFPNASNAFHVIRYTALAIILLTALATSWSTRFKESIHLLTAVMGFAIGLCTTALFAIAPYPASLAIFTTLAFVCLVSTIFVATLHLQYSAVGALAVCAVFALCVFQLSSIPLNHAVGLVFALLVVTCASLTCTNIIERYARVNFAQRRALNEQAAAIAEKAQQLEISEGKARDANLAKSVFLSNMSHELRTPLNAVLGFAQLMERDPTLGVEGRANLEIIQRSGDHLLALINDVLAISKIEAGRVTLTEHAFDLHAVVRSVSEMIRVRTDTKGLQFLVSIAPDVPSTVVGDEGKLRQVLVNLLGNAVKFTDTGGIALRVGSNAATIQFEVEDTGFGIAADELGTLFEAFSQTESGRRSKEGTGLGLAISHNFVRLMGGEIRAQSELNRGTTFTVEVPMPIAENAAPVTKARRVVCLAPGQPLWRILVVDDTAENRILLIKLLTMVGFDVREATNGQEAIDLFRSWHPHLIWMDMRMAVMDGYDATRRIREEEVARGRRRPPQGHGPPCKIIALTASAFQHDRERILANGCDDFVTKPFREATIFDTLSAQLGARFLFDDGEKEDTGGYELSQERLMTLPPDLLASLRSAMLIGDIEAANLAVEKIQERDEPLGDELHRLVRAFRFGDVLDALG